VTAEPAHGEQAGSEDQAGGQEQRWRVCIPQTLRINEREGLMQPVRSAGGTGRYSRNNVLRLQEICALSGESLNMAGIRRVLQSQEETRQLQAEVARLKKLGRRNAR